MPASLRTVLPAPSQPASQPALTVPPSASTAVTPVASWAISTTPLPHSGRTPSSASRSRSTASTRACEITMGAAAVRSPGSPNRMRIIGRSPA